MGRLRYSLQRLLWAVTLLGLVAWAVAAPSVLRCVCTVAAWSLPGAAWGRRRQNHAVGLAAVAGAAAVIAFIIGCWAVFLGGYLFYDGPAGYFEDGFIAEVLLYPVIYGAVYAPLGAVMGATIGFGVWYVDDRFGRRFRPEPVTSLNESGL